MCQQLTSILGAISCEGRFDARELADAGNCTTSTIHHAQSNPDRNLTFSTALRISRYLSKNGDNRIAKLFLDPSYTVKKQGTAFSNGIIDDECNELVKVAGNLSHAFETGDDNKMEYFIDRLEEVVLRYRAELGNLRS